MNYCPQAKKVADYYLDGLAGKDRENFEIHLKSCEICQHELKIERAIDKELSEEFDPGFIENKVKVRLQLRQVQDTRSFWLYALRMAVCGITAAIAGFVLIPMLVKFLSGVSLDLSHYAQGAAELLGNLAPGSLFLVVLGFCYISVFIASMYSLVQMRR